MTLSALHPAKDDGYGSCDECSLPVTHPTHTAPAYAHHACDRAIRENRPEDACEGCQNPGEALGLPDLPYAGTSGWSGSDTSRERAVRDDTDGTTTERQGRTLAYLFTVGAEGVTWKDLSASQNWHHGQASGVLSVLHKEGRVARLAERRDRCEVYVLPEYVNGRDTKAHGRNTSAAALARVQAVLPRCHSFVEPHTCRRPESGRTPYSPYLADGYCLPCQIARAIDGTDR